MFVQLKKDYFGQKPGQRLDIDEPVAKTLIEQGIAEAIQGDPLAPLLAKSMEGLLANLTSSLNSTIDATLKEFATNAAKSRKNAVPAIFGQGGEGDPKRTFGQFLLAVRRGDAKALEEMGSQFVEWANDAEKKTAMSTQAGVSGGYLVPTEFYSRLMQLATENSVVRRRATIIPMSGRTIQVPTLDVTTAPSSGDAAFLGGVVARWTEEATALNETEPNLKQLDLTNHELSGYSKVSNTLLQDSAMGLDALLQQLFGRAIAWYEDYAYLRGNGTGKPLGILNWSGFVSVTRSGASAFALADVAGMLGRLLPGGDRNTICFVIHPTVLVKLITMTGGDHVIFLGNDVRNQLKMQILGYDVEVSEKVPALNTTGDAILADFQHYLIGDRQGIEIAFSEHVAFLNNQSVWRFVRRVAGMPWLRDKITLADATNSLSPFIGLT